MLKRNPLKTPLPYTVFNVTYILIGINVAAFVMAFVVRDLMIWFALKSPLTEAFVQFQGAVDTAIYRFQPWQFLTYMFAHNGAPPAGMDLVRNTSMWHLGFNMLSLFFFGPPTERRMGSWEFLVFYLLVGMLSGVASFAFYAATNSIALLLGASGALYGVLLAFATYHPDANIYLFGIVPIPAPILVVGLAILSIVSPIIGRGGQTAHLTHLMGFVFAFFYLWLRLGENPIEAFRRR